MVMMMMVMMMMMMMMVMKMMINVKKNMMMMVEPFRQKSQLFADYIILGVGDHKFCAVASCKQDAGEGKERK